MRRCGYLLPRIAAMDNVALAFFRASQGKGGQPEVEAYRRSLSENSSRLVSQLASASWRPGCYRTFVVRDPKLRVIHAASFADRVAHHALMNVAGPIFEQGASKQSFACRKGLGNRAALQYAARNCRRFSFCLKLDMRRYFDSVSHRLLNELLQRRFKDRGFLRILESIISSFEHHAGAGLPIGTLCSQYLANFYLDGFDHWLQRTLRIPACARYMDDVVLWSDDARRLQESLPMIEDWLSLQRCLTLKGAPVVRPCRDGLAFLGYRLKPQQILLGRRSRRRFVARLAGCEQAWADGGISSADLMRRCDALLAHVSVADCSDWRRRVLSAAPIDGGLLS